jgi:hypothetical protein
MKDFFQYLSSLSEEDRLDKIHVYLLLQSIVDQWKLNRRAELMQTLFGYRVRCTWVSSLSEKNNEFNAPFYALGLADKKLNVILDHLDDYALPELFNRQFIALSKTEDGKNNFVTIPIELQDKLAQDNYAEFERILLKQIEKCMDPQKCNELVIKSKKEISTDMFKCKKISTPWEKLSRRIKREMKRVKLIGDVSVDDEEFALLEERFISCYKKLVNAGVSSDYIFDETFLVAMVQLGIRCYRDGRFWPEISGELGIDIPSHRHDGILRSFIKSAKKYNKRIFTENPDIENILAHGFVSNGYLDSFFDFLFTYYRIDMERDMGQCETADLVNAVIEKNSHVREQLIRTHTQKAFSINTKGVKIRVRRIITLMDRLFFDDDFRLVSSNRIYSGLASWAKKSTAFAKERDSREYNGTGTKGLRMTTSPYIKADYDGIQSFSIIIPKQLIRSDSEIFPDKILVKIKTTEKAEAYPLEIYGDRGITGFRTKEISIPISHEQLFLRYSFELAEENSKMRSLPSISKSDVRFFNEDGYLLSGEKLKTGKIYAYCRAQDEITSSCIVDMIVFGNIRRSDFFLEEGDIVFLPSGKPVSAGKIIAEGVSEKGLVRGIIAKIQNCAINLYREIPYVILKMKPDRIASTIISINGNRRRASCVMYTEFSIDENSEERGYFVNLSNLGISANGIYTLNISVPNDSTSRVWTFALIHDFDFEFDGAPYIFKSAGCITIRGCDSIYPLDEVDLLGEQVYGFEFIPGRTDLQFEKDLMNEKLIISIPIPALFWKMNETDEWNSRQIDDLWYDQLPNVVFFMFPTNEIELVVSDLPDDEDDTQYTFTKSVAKGYFICDITKLKSNLDKRRAIWIVDLSAGAHEIELLKVGTKNVIIRTEIRPDYDHDGIICMIDYFGKNLVAYDIEFEGLTISEKVVVEEKPVRIDAKPLSGIYTIRTYELIENDLGFDDEFEELETIQRELIDPNDLSNQTIFLDKLIDTKLGGLELPLLKGNHIYGLQRISQDKYRGKLICPLINGNNYCMDAVVYFAVKGENSCYIQFTDEDDELDLEYDKLHRTLVQNEESDLSKKDAYIRYKLLYDQNQYFKYALANNLSNRR